MDAKSLSTSSHFIPIALLLSWSRKPWQRKTVLRCSNLLKLKLHIFTGVLQSFTYCFSFSKKWPAYNKSFNVAIKIYQSRYIALFYLFPIFFFFNIPCQYLSFLNIFSSFCRYVSLSIFFRYIFPGRKEWDCLVWDTQLLIS